MKTLFIIILSVLAGIFLSLYFIFSTHVEFYQCYREAERKADAHYISLCSDNIELIDCPSNGDINDFIDTEYDLDRADCVIDFEKKNLTLFMLGYLFDYKN